MPLRLLLANRKVSLSRPARFPLTILGILMIPISFELGWLKSVTYVSALSLWALVAGHLSTWQAARVEVTQETEAKRQLDNPVEERVVDKMVAETTVQESA